MGRISLEVRDKDLQQLGEYRLKEEIEHTLKWMKMKGFLKSISSPLRSLKVDYGKEVQKIRRDAWKEYKKGLPL